MPDGVSRIWFVPSCSCYEVEYSNFFVISILKKTKETMIIGVDTYHDSETRGASYMGVVASLNEQCTK